MTNEFLATVTFFLVGAVVILSVIGWAIPVRLWIEAISASVRVGIGFLIGMRLRKVSPPAVVRPLIPRTGPHAEELPHLGKQNAIVGRSENEVVKLLWLGDARELRP